MSWNLLYAVDVLAIVVFGVSYYKNCYRCGFRIDFWHSQLFFFCVLPNMILLPFTRNEMNRVVLGQDFDAVMAVLPSVFLVTLAGYFSMLAGGMLWRIHTGIGVRRAALPVLDFIPRCSMMLMSSRRLLVLQSLLCIVLQASILLVFWASAGFGFSLRDYTFAHPQLRPVAMTISNYSVIIASHALARYVDRKERILLACTVLLTFGLFFFGARALLLGVCMNVLMCYFVQLRARLNIFWFIPLVLGMVTVGFYLGDIRSGQFSLMETLASLGFLLLYGNNFSDLRDFAWVYAGWNHVFWGGKTYLAALTSFVPRFASQFRDTWGLGVATDLAVGLDPQVHPGLRPGQFGEGYFNFGLLGAIGVGLLLGILSRRVDIATKMALTRRRPSMMEAFASTQLLGVSGWVAISVNLSGFYVACGIYLFSWICLQVMRLTSTIREQVASTG